ncbi:MAG: DUF4293 domain-containing protein [Bacteroidales bacterium]|jgi:hypothetical protein|nr:DUF4293 domain-containing protein [Bacteroidales bacterium]
MIQRIQSAWLLLAAIASMLLFVLPIATFSIEGIAFFKFYTYGLDYADPFTAQLEMLYRPFMKYSILLAALVATVIPVLTIFLYKNRSRQMYLSRLTILLNVVLLVVFFLLSDSFAETTQSTSKYGVACYLPIFSIIMLFLAIRGIKKDENTVRSADRIR